MGMSGDYKIAIEEGSNMIRIEELIETLLVSRDGTRVAIGAPRARRHMIFCISSLIKNIINFAIKIPSK